MVGTPARCFHDALPGECCDNSKASGLILYLPDGARHFLSRQAYNLAYETEGLDDRERAWRRVRKCRRQLGSPPDGLGGPYPEKPVGMLRSRYAYLLARLDTAEADLNIPLIRGGPRFERNPARWR